MSQRISGKVFDHYPGQGGEFTLALALAEHANPDGTRIFPSVATLARMSRQSERNVQRQLRAMEKSGWLLLVHEESRAHGRPREYRINPAWIAACQIASPGDMVPPGSCAPPGDNLSPGALVDKSAEPGDILSPPGGTMSPGRVTQLCHPDHTDTKKSFSRARAVEKPTRRVDASTAWVEVRAAIARGAKPAAWSDPRIEPALIELGGFYPLSEKTSKDLDWLSVAFAKAFDQAAVLPAKRTQGNQGATA